MKILYFTNGQISTKEANEIAEQYDNCVAFRDASKPIKAIEECDAVAGEVPVEYQRAFHIGQTNEVMEEVSGDVVNSFELPTISEGARSLITEHELSDEELQNVVPTGKNGIIKSDVEKYLEGK